MIAFNFYEPLARLLAGTRHRLGLRRHALPAGDSSSSSLLLLRLTTETLAPAMVRFPTPVYHLGRLFFALGDGAGHDGDPPPGLRHRPGAQEDLRRHRLQVQAPVRPGARPPVAGLLPVHDRRHLRPVRIGPVDPYGVVRQGRQRARPVQRLRPAGRVAARPPGGPPLRRQGRSWARTPEAAKPRPEPAKAAGRRRAVPQPAGLAAAVAGPAAEAADQAAAPHVSEAVAGRRPAPASVMPSSFAGYRLRSAPSAELASGARAARSSALEDVPTDCCWIL